MQQCAQRLLIGGLALAAAAAAPLHLSAQTALTLTVEDSSGAALAGATVVDEAGRQLGRTNNEGRLAVPCAASCNLRVAAAGFFEKHLQLSADTAIRLKPASTNEEVTVTAYRAPLGALESPTTSRLLSQTALDTTPAITLDGEMRQLPGVELFRRSSSLVANPSSQGVSLRGLGSTSASRTLVTEDDVPLNDPFGGWIHWEEQPELSVKSIELVRGGASDLYGSSAIGGIISLAPSRPTSDLAELRSSYGAEGTFDDSMSLQAKRGVWGLMFDGGVLGTDGYIQEAPWQRGPVDIASNMHSQNGVILAEHDTASRLRLFVRGSGFNEARNNGTPLQTNGTRLWRYATGGDWQGPHNGSLTMRLYGSTEHYRQTFSNIANPTTLRNSETLTKFSLTPDNELGATAHWSQPLGAGLLIVAGADTHDVRVWDREQSFVSSPPLTNLHDHQRDSAAYAELMWVRHAWTMTASSRMDWFQNYDGQQLSWSGSSWTPSATQPPQFDQRVFDPRLGLARKLWNHWAISSSGFRAFRSPTPNELYRSTQVGNQLTLPNGTLLSERATGWEAGLATEWRWGTIRSSYFLTQVNRPITAVIINAKSSPILLQRENLGQIESRGVALDFTLAPRRWMAIDGGYQYAHGTVTQDNLEASLVGNWIPEVARNMATLNMHAYQPRIGTINLQSRLSGRQFDDAANAALLHGYFRLDAYASHNFGERFEMFTAGENLFDRQIEVAKTPTTTLSMPRVARVGFRVRLGGTGR
ncbi:MAG: TonB-dependent receptor [Terracidiphilus sp.]|jgi:outer membrane receptor protein involved in Fe transport